MKGPIGESIVYDAIHQVMSFPPSLNEMLKELLDLPLFQRLRQIKQLAMSELVFPAASHSRFSHALGTCHLALRILRQLGKWISIHPELERHVAVAALLHDVGHGPFSHAFESFLYEAIGMKVMHEDWTQYFLNDDELSRVLKRHGIDATLIHHLITKKGEARKEVFASYDAIPDLLLGSDVIASQLDADRLDYLLRDSHFCGVSYGTYDVNWLINCLVPVSTASGWRLGITDKGVGVVENFLLARRLMYKNIYYHPKLIALEKLLMAMLREVEQLIDEDNKLAGVLGEPLSGFLKNLRTDGYASAEAFHEAKYKDYRYLCDFDIWNMVRQIDHPSSQFKGNYEQLRHIASRFSHRRCPKMFRVRHDKLAKLEVENFRREHGCADWELGFVEISFQLYATNEDPILIAEYHVGKSDPADAIPVRLNERSELVQHLSDHIEPQYYLMIDQDFYQSNKKRILDLEKRLEQS